MSLLLQQYLGIFAVRSIANKSPHSPAPTPGLLHSGRQEHTSVKNNILHSIFTPNYVCVPFHVVLYSESIMLELDK